MDFNMLFEAFVREKLFLVNVTHKTEIWYRMSWKAFVKAMGVPQTITQQMLNEFVVKLREKGLVAKSCNTYSCALNSFLSWLHDNGHIPERLKIKELKEESKVVRLYTDAEILAFVNWRPKKWVEHRLYALLMTLIDTGARIDIELLRLTWEDVDLENLFIKLRGKGGRERYVPMSFDIEESSGAVAEHEQEQFRARLPIRTGHEIAPPECL